MTPLEWEIRLHKEQKWGNAYPHVEREVRAYLNTLAAGVTISTNQLVEALYPVASVRGEGNGRQRIYEALKATHHGRPAMLEDCRMRGPVKKIHGGIKGRPWLWHKPTPRLVCCPNCQYEFEISRDHQDRQQLQTVDTTADASLPQRSAHEE
jgi:hypothetical protein